MMKNIKYILILIILSYFFLMFGNGILSLSNPDEVFYAQTAREMVKHNTWMTPYLFGEPQFEKPILTYWLLRIGFIIFGVTSFSARFFPALFGIIGVIAVYLLGVTGFKDRKKAFLSAVILMSGGLYIGLSRTVFTDLIFSVFILLSLLSFYWGYADRKKKTCGLILFFIFSGLAVLTKGPLGFSIPVLCALFYLFVRKDLKFLACKASLWGALVFLAVILPWYLLMIYKYGHSFNYEFFYNCHIRRVLEAEHTGNDTWYFYPMSMVGCTFPWSVFVAGALFCLPGYLRKKKEPFLVFLFGSLAVIFFTFQFAHSKLTSYIVPLFPVLSLLAAYFICEKIASGKRVIRVLYTLNMFMLLAFISGLILCLTVYAGTVAEYILSKAPILQLLAGFAVLFILALIFFLRKKLEAGVYCFAFVMPVMLSIIPLIKDGIDPYLSSKYACEYLLKNYEVNNVILCSKPYVRGVHYYTDKEVAVTSIPGMPFFSPHPVAFLNTDEKVEEFFRKQKVTYCVLKKSSFEDIERIAKERGFQYTLLKIFANVYILKVEPE